MYNVGVTHCVTLCIQVNTIDYLSLVVVVVLVGGVGWCWSWWVVGVIGGGDGGVAAGLCE